MDNPIKAELVPVGELARAEEPEAEPPPEPGQEVEIEIESPAGKKMTFRGCVLRSMTREIGFSGSKLVIKVGAEDLVIREARFDPHIGERNTIERGRGRW